MPWRVSSKDPSGRLQEWVDEPPVRPGGRKAVVRSLTPPSLTKTSQVWDGERWVPQRSLLPLGGTSQHELIPLSRPMERQIEEPGDQDDPWRSGRVQPVPSGDLKIAIRSFELRLKSLTAAVEETSGRRKADHDGKHRPIRTE